MAAGDIKRTDQQILPSHKEKGSRNEFVENVNSAQIKKRHADIRFLQKRYILVQYFLPFIPLRFIYWQCSSFHPKLIQPSAICDRQRI